MKWFVLYHLIFRHEAFDEPYDGIVYAVAVSLGYATLENIIYAFLNAASFSALMIRALLPVSAHALFGVMMGYYLGRRSSFLTKLESICGSHSCCRFSGMDCLTTFCSFQIQLDLGHDTGYDISMDSYDLAG